MEKIFQPSLPKKAMAVITSRMKPQHGHAHTLKLIVAKQITSHGSFNMLINSQFYSEIFIQNSQKYTWPLSPRICVFLHHCADLIKPFVATSRVETNVSLDKIFAYLFLVIIFTSLQCSVKSSNVDKNFLSWGPTLFAEPLNRCPTNIGISILKITFTTLHKDLTTLQSENKC
jgi:hypothetical protein